MRIKIRLIHCFPAHRDEVENRTLSFWFQDLKLVPPNYIFGDPFDFEPPVQWTELVSSLEQYQIHTLFKPHFVATENTAPIKLVNFEYF